jgi:GntR family transcriptional regulator
MPLFLQIAQQLKYLILSSQVKVGTQLPSSRQLAQFFHVNRQTIYNAVRVLEDEGLVDTRQGAGIFVKANVGETSDFDESLLQIAQTAIRQGAELGYTYQDVMKAVSFVGFTDGVDIMQSDSRYIVFVECNEPVLESYKTDIEKELKIKVVPFLLERTRTEETEFCRLVENASLVVTTFTHLHEIKSLLKDNPKLVGISAGPYMDLMLEISRWSKNSKITVLMVRKVGAVEVAQSIIDAGIKFKNIICLGLEDPDLKKCLEQTEKLIISRAAYQSIKDELKSIPNIAIYENKLDRASLNMLTNLIKL